MKVASLFCGIGGLDKGFINAGFDVVWANDFDKYAVETYNANFDTPAPLADITQYPLEDIPEFDVLIGGFPCQPFSMMGQFIPIIMILRGQVHLDSIRTISTLQVHTK